MWHEIDKYNYTYTCPKTGIIYDLIVGKNKYDNWKIIDESNENDYWFHLEDCPSVHVIVCKKELNIDKNDKNYKIDKGLIKFASWLCKKKSKKENEKISIVYTQIKNLSKATQIGSVYMKSWKTYL
jgi:predicted ribosome quality control (RQC) complex YloA/Tae2 family protein